MKITFKENIDTRSYVLKHTILLEATNLIIGREGVLQTEKDLYLILAFMDSLSQDNLIEYCNEDTRELGTILREDIEPQFLDLMEKAEYKELYDEMRTLFIQRCQEIWNEQHSLLGIIDSLLTTIASMSEEEKKEVLVETGKIAEAAYNRRTEILKEKADNVNDKLEEFVRSYQQKINEQKDTQE